MTSLAQNIFYSEIINDDETPKDRSSASSIPDVLLGEVLNLAIDGRSLKAVVIWTNSPTCGVIYLDESGRAASPARLARWLPEDARGVLGLTETCAAVSANGGLVFRKKRSSPQAKPGDGVIVDVTLETGRQCRGIACWPRGAVATVRLVYAGHRETAFDAVKTQTATA